MSRKILCIIAAVVAAGGLGACGGGDDESGSDHAAGRPTVYAASSLRGALPELLPAATYSFGGSNTLRTQIERGAPADVLIAASPKDARALAAAGRCSGATLVATNQLVLIEPAAGPPLGLDDLSRGGRRIAVGSEGVPIGDYTRKLLTTAGAEAVLTRNRVSAEPDVASIVAKVRARSADAGFAYVTDARAAGDAVRAIHLPARLQPTVRYAACVVRRDGSRTAAARAYLARLTAARTQARLVDLGFGRAP